MCFIGVTRGDTPWGFNLRARDKVSVFLRFSGCAFLTYYSRDSAISAQNALHEKRTLPGVSVYNVYCKQFTYFSTNYATSNATSFRVAPTPPRKSYLGLA